MAGKFLDVLDAVIPAAFVATIAGTCFSGADYVALLSTEHLLETSGWLVPGWDTVHATTNYGMVALMTAVVAGMIGWRMYRTARLVGAQQRRRR